MKMMKRREFICTGMAAMAVTLIAKRQARSSIGR